jgi:hypothetical protein
VFRFKLRPLYLRGKGPQEAGWAPETVWMTWKRENSWPYRSSNSDLSVIHLLVSRYTHCAIPVPERRRWLRNLSYFCNLCRGIEINNKKPHSGMSVSETSWIRSRSDNHAKIFSGDHPCQCWTENRRFRDLLDFHIQGGYGEWPCIADQFVTSISLRIGVLCCWRAESNCAVTHPTLTFHRVA